MDIIEIVGGIRFWLDFIGPFTLVFAFLGWVTAVRAARRGKQKIKVLFVSPSGQDFDPGVSLRRDELTRAEVLGRCGQAVGGQSAGVALPAPTQASMDACKDTECLVLELKFQDEEKFQDACAKARIISSGAPLGFKPKLLPLPAPATAQQVEVLAEKLAKLEEMILALAASTTEANRQVVEVVRTHTQLIDSVYELPQFRRLRQKATNGQRG